MKKNFYLGVGLPQALIAVLMLFFSSHLLAKEINNTTVATTAETGDIFIDSGGTRYVYLNPYSNKRLYISPGQRLLMLSEHNGYVYSDPVFSGSIYAGDYLADGGFATQTAKLTAVTALRETTTVMNHVQNRIANVLNNQVPVGFQLALGSGKNMLSNGEKGLSAGDAYEDAAYGVWVEGGYSHIKDTNPVTAFKANLYNGTIGFDMTTDNEALLGLAYSYGHMGNGKTDYNRGKIKQHTHTLNPYAAYRFHDNFSLDTMIGYTRVSKKFERTPAHIVDDVVYYDDNAEKFTGNTKSRRIYGGLFGNMNYKPHKDYLLGLRLGYLYLHEKQDEYTESSGENYPGLKVSIGRISTRAKAEYIAEKLFQPFIQAGFNYDSTLTKFTFSQGAQPNNRRSTYMLGAGFNTVADNLHGGLEFAHDFGRKLRITTVLARVRYIF